MGVLRPPPMTGGVILMSHSDERERERTLVGVLRPGIGGDESY